MAELYTAFRAAGGWWALGDTPSAVAGRGIHTEGAYRWGVAARPWRVRRDYPVRLPQGVTS